MSPASLPNEFYPLLADYDPSDISAYQLVWATFREMPEFSRKLLTSDELPYALKDFSEKFSLTQSTAAFISVMVRKIIFQEWDEAQSQLELTAWCQEFDSKNTSRVDEILEAVKRDILTIVPSEEGIAGETEKIVTVRMTLLEALSQYPQLGQQTITETRIKLKTSTELVRGSLINWLKCYREELGVGYHDAILRGQFLFRSQNGLRLTSEEHGRIEILLRSIEDREVVEIDTVHQILIFPPAPSPKSSPLEQEKSLVSKAPLAPAAPPMPMPVQMREKQAVSVATPEKEISHSALGETGSLHVLNKAQFSPSNQTLGTLHFSSKHVLPVEKEIQSHNQETTKNSGPLLSGKADVPVSPVPPVASTVQMETASPVVNNLPHPAPAPKRDVNSDYIPKPYRIDPTQRDLPEREE
jgi:hypothetical protein